MDSLANNPLTRIPKSCSSQVLQRPRPWLRKTFHFSHSKHYDVPKCVFLRIRVRAGLEELIHNQVLISATVAGLGSQLLKPFVPAVLGRGFNWELALTSGGMPSSHSSSVVAAATAIGLERGFADSLFGLSVVIAGLIMYDAQGDMDAPSQTPSVEEKARMTADQMRSEIRASYLHNIALSTDLVFITQQIKQRYIDELVNIIIEGDKSEEKEALRMELGRRIQSLQTFVPFVTSHGEHGDGRCAQPSSHYDVQTPPSVVGPLLPSALSATRAMQTSSSMPTRTVDRLAESSTGEVDPFPGAVRVISIGSYKGTLLLNKKTIFPLRERKLPGNNVFFEHLFHMTLRLFGPTIRTRWNLQTTELKNQLIASFDEKFGKDMFDNGLLLKRAAKHIKTVRDQYRRALKDNPKYDRPAMIPPMEWNEIVEDAKEKRLSEDRGNEAAQGKKRLQDTSVATKARVEKFGQHKLGSGGYMNLQSRVGTEFNVEVTDEDRKLALKEGYKFVVARLVKESISLAQESSSPNDISQPSYPTTEPARDEGHKVHYSGGEHVEHHVEGVEHVPSVQHVDVAADQNVNVHDVALSEPPLVQQPPAPAKRRSHRNLTLHVLEEEENDADMDAPMRAFLKRAHKNKKKK